MPSAEIITIGTELLLGEIADTNTRYLARCLRDAGIDLFRTTTVGDNAGRIAQAIQQSMERSDIVITAGGLGPTVDDATREAVALAANTETLFQPQLWEQIKARFQRYGRLPTENNRRQAYIPIGAEAIENPLGTAPIFILNHNSHLIIALPGVPREMEYLMEHSIIPYLRKYYNLHGIIKARVLHTVGVGESQIDDRIGDLEELSNPTVGLAAHSGQVDVRITAKADSEKAADELIHPIELELRKRMGDWIYGVDKESLEEIALQSLTDKKWKLTIFEAGLDGKLIRRLAPIPGPFVSGQVSIEPVSMSELIKSTLSLRNSHHAETGFGVSIKPLIQSHEVLLVLITPTENQQFTRLYGGPPEYAPIWAINQSLDIIRGIAHGT